MVALNAEIIIKAADRASRVFGAVGKSAVRSANVLGRSFQRTAAVGMRAAGAASVATAGAIGGAVHQAVAFEDAMADVKKVVDFDSPDGLAQLSNDIINISKSVPVAADGLAEIAAAAGMAGIAAGDISEFTETAAKISIAFGMSAAESGEAMAKLRTALGMTQEEIERLFDGTNVLANNFAAKESQIINFSKRVGAQAAQFGFSAEQAQAFGTAMIAAGSETEVAATSFRNMGRALTKGVSATKAQREAFKRLGLDASDVAKRMQKDALGTTLEVLAKLKELPAELRAATSNQLFGSEARALAPLINDTETLTKAIALLGDEKARAGSVDREFAARMDTTRTKMQLMKNQISAAAIIIGDAFLPLISDGVEKVTAFLQGVDMNAFAGRVRGAFSAIGTAIGSAVDIANRFAQSLGFEGVGDAFGSLVDMVKTSLATVGEYLSGFDWEGYLSGGIEVFKTYAKAIMPILEGVFAGLSNFDLSAITKLASAVANAFAGVIGFVDGILEGLGVDGGLGTVINFVLTLIGDLVEALGTLASWVFPSGFAEGFKDVGLAIGTFFKPVADVVSGVYNFLIQITEEIIRMADKLMAPINRLGELKEWMFGAEETPSAYVPQQDILSKSPSSDVQTLMADMSQLSSFALQPQKAELEGQANVNVNLRVTGPAEVTSQNAASQGDIKANVGTDMAGAVPAGG